MIAKGEIKAGDRVKISDLSDRRLQYDATVIKAGRAWCEVQRDGWGRTEHFRLDTQTPYAPGKGYGSAPHLYTLAQWAERERRLAANAYLQSQGIRFDRSTEAPWTATTLADALRLAQAVGDPRELLALIEEYGDARVAGFTEARKSDPDATLAEIKQRLGITDEPS